MVDLVGYSKSPSKEWELRIDRDEIQIWRNFLGEFWVMPRASAVELCELLKQLRLLSHDAQAAMDGG